MAIIAWTASWLLEDWAWWAALKSKVKSLLILGMAALLGLGATALLNNPALLAAIAPYLNVVVAIAAAWLSTQVAHKFDKGKTEEPASEAPFG